MPKARLYFDGDNTGIEKESRTYSLTQSVEDKIDSISTIESTLQGEIDDLQDQINHVASRGRYLTTWNCTTGLPDTNPTTDPYVYRAGDYYIVSTIGGTNYRPSGSEYHINVASQAIEPQTVSVNDLYIYDGTHWTLQRTGASVFAVWGSITGNLQAQIDLQNALDAKANKTDVLEKTNTTSYTPTANYHPATKKYVDDNDTYIGTSAPTDNVVEGRLWYDTASDVLKVYNGSQWVPTGKTYTAGNHINISSADVISTTGLQDELIAGNNITIQSECHPNNQGPCPDGFHIPTNSEIDALWSYSNLNLYKAGLKLPPSGRRDQYASLDLADCRAFWTCTPSDDTGAYEFVMTGNGNRRLSQPRACAYPIRPMRNTPVTPDSTWTDTFSFGNLLAKRSSDLGLISLTIDGGTTWHTFSDKNLGATTVYNEGDTLSDANCGYMYQWGNNYPFSSFGTIPYVYTYSGVDASGYGPGNYYISSDYIVPFAGWDSSKNSNLWGGINPSGTRCRGLISATDTTYTASDFDIKDLADSTNLRTAWDGKLGVSTDAGNLLSAGDKLWLGSTTDFSSIVSPDANTMYIQYVSDSPTPPTPWQPGANTIAYYPLTSQTTVYDQSGNNHTLTESHTATPGTVSYGTYGGVDCCYIDIGELSASITSYTGPRTVLGWYQQIGQPNNDSSWIFGYGNGGTMGGWGGIIVNGKTRPATDKVCGLADGIITGNTSLSLNTWYFLAMTLDGTRNIGAVKIYVNGQLDVQNTSTLGSGATTTNIIGISGDTWLDRSMRGYVSGVIFENKEWTAREISDYFDQTKGDYGIS